MALKSTILLSFEVTDDSWYRNVSRQKELEKSKNLIKKQTYVNNTFSD